jgi:Protein of unknown function (DUF2950)
MTFRNRRWLRGSFFAILVLYSPVFGRAQDVTVKTFPTYRKAVAEFVSAVKANNDVALKEILGADAQGMLTSGDPTTDENDRLAFLKHYDEAHGFVRQTADKVILTVGATAWPLPFPIVRVNGAWQFDAEEGARELRYRRIGNNELDAIRVCRALHAAQKEYAATGHDGNPPGAFAQRFRSEPGTQNGLFWEAEEGQPDSPAGSLVAEATAEGVQSGKPTPFHGYFFRMIKAQGPHAPGGAKEFVKDGRMTGGFAILAYPAEYGASGITSFIVGPAGKVYQKDLGEGTTETARAITTFDPDSSWKLIH